VVQIRGGPPGEIDEFFPLRREVSVTPEGSDQFVAECQRFPVSR
jgi:hypothetical protein